MLTIRLSRRGKKKQPNYRILISEKTKDPRGSFLEDLGFYNPKSKEIKFKEERIKYWLSKGAQTSATIHNLLVSRGIIKGPKIKIGKEKKEKKEESAKGEEKISEKTSEETIGTE